MSYVYIGLVIGAVYAIFGNSITLTYSATGVLNLATGAMAYTSASLFYYLVENLNWPLWSAGIVAALVVGPALGFILWGAVFRRMEQSDLVVQVVATIGISVALPALAQMLWLTGQVQQSPGIVPNGLHLVHLGFVNLTRNEVAAIIGAAICVVGLVLLVDRTRFGLTMRAVVDRPRLAQARGINTNLVSCASWMLSGLLIGIGGVLLAPIITLDPGVYTDLTVTALAVALVGRFRSLIWTTVAALALGVANSLLIGYAPQGSTLIQDIAPSLPFLLLTGLLLLGWSPVTARRDAVQAQGGARLTRRPAPDEGALDIEPEETDVGLTPAGARAAPALTRAPVWFSGRNRQISVVVAGLIGAAGLLLFGMYAFNDVWTSDIGVGLAFSVIFLSFTVATGEGAVLCLGEAAFVGVAGFLAGRFVSATGLPLWAAAIVAVMSAGILGLVVGAIGSRLDQIGFALVTLAFALFCDQFAFNIVKLVPTIGVAYPTVTLFGLNQARTNVLLGFVTFAILSVLIWTFKRGTLGRVYAALRGNPISSESLGLNVKALRTSVFAVAAAIAGLGGVLYGINEQQLSGVDVELAIGLVWLAVVVTFGVRGVLGAFLAGLVFALFPDILAAHTTANWASYLPTVLFGLGAVGLAKEPRGFLAPLGDKLWTFTSRRLPPPKQPSLALAGAGAGAGSPRSSAPVEGVGRP